MKYGKCNVCGVYLLQRGGFHQTSLCGPCCTGESDTLHTFTSICADCKIGFEHDDPKAVRCFHCARKKQLATR